MCSDIRFGHRRQFSHQNNRRWSFWKRLSSFELHSYSFSVIRLPLSWPPTRIIFTRSSLFLMCFNLHPCLGHTCIPYFLVSVQAHQTSPHCNTWNPILMGERVCVCVRERERERERRMYLPYPIQSSKQLVLTNISAVLYVDRLTTPYSLLLIPWIFVHSIFLKPSEMH